MNQMVVPQSGLLDVTVARRVTEADGIESFVLLPAPGSSLLPFTAGAHVDVHLGSGLVRQYSLSNDPVERHRYVIAVLKEQNGRGGSVEVHETLAEGKALRISAPRNNFPLDMSAARYVLVAGGIGITPILSMAHALNRAGKDFELHYCARSEGRAAFADALRHMPFSQSVKLHFDDAAPETRFHPARDVGAPADGKQLYVCGPSGFMDFVVESAGELGWEKSRLHLERFQAPTNLVVEGAAFTVLAAKSGVSVEVGEGQSIADALLDAGVEVPLSCEQGICGTCLIPVLEGLPDHRDAFQTDAEKATNANITVCCSRALSKSLKLDI